MAETKDIVTRSASPAAPAAVVPETSEQRLITAKKDGHNDRGAAMFAGITFAALRDCIRRDPTLRLKLDQAHAEGFSDHLNWLKKSSQFSAHHYAIQTFFPDLARIGKGNHMKKSAIIQSFQEVTGKMTPDQLARAAELLELGRVIDNERKTAAARSQADSCPANQELSPDAPQTPSDTNLLPAPNNASATLSPLPGES